MPGEGSGLRYQHASDLLADLKRLKRDTESGRAATLGVSPELPRQTVKAPFFRSRWKGVALGMGLLILAGVGVLWYEEHRPEPPTETLLTPIPLTSYPGYENTPSFSPDDTQVAFQWCTEEPAVNCDIYVKQIGVEPPSRLTADPAEDFSPAWSPDGQSIAFLRKLSATRTLLILIPQRGGSERVLGECDIAYHILASYPTGLLAWTLDSKWLVVPRMESGEPSAGLSLFNVETREARRFTTRPYDQAPAFSPDARTLAFNRWDSNDRQLIYFLRLAEGYHPQGEPERIAPVAESYDNFGTACSPDEKEIVFSSGYSGNAGLWRGWRRLERGPEGLPSHWRAHSHPQFHERGTALPMS